MSLTSGFLEVDASTPAAVRMQIERTEADHSQIFQRFVFEAPQRLIETDQAIRGNLQANHFCEKK